MFLIHDVVLILNTKVSDIWHLRDIFQSAKMPLFALVSVNDYRLLLVPVVVSLRKDVLKGLQELSDG